MDLVKCEELMAQVNVHEAKTHLSRLIERAAQGEVIVIARAGRPVAQLTALDTSPQMRRFGAMKGRAAVDDCFFEPLPDDELAAWE
jgi:prevent-host-death family protein